MPDQTPTPTPAPDDRPTPRRVLHFTRTQSETDPTLVQWGPAATHTRRPASAPPPAQPAPAPGPDAMADLARLLAAPITAADVTPSRPVPAPSHRSGEGIPASATPPATTPRRRPTMCRCMMCGFRAARSKVSDQMPTTPTQWRAVRDSAIDGSIVQTLYRIPTPRPAAFAAHVGRYVCNDCYGRFWSHCAQCEALHPINLQAPGQIGRVCGACAHQLARCGRCGVYLNGPAEDRRSGDTPNSAMCLVCYEHRPILGHRAKPYLRPVGDGPYFLGLELEVECDTAHVDRAANPNAYINARARQCVQLLGHGAPHWHAIVKSDGSLHYGFELVTRPAGLAVHETRLREFCAGVDGLDLVCYRSPRCGLHVHVSRAPMTELQIAKVVLLVSAPRNRSFVERLAGRAASAYAVIQPKKLVDVYDRNCRAIKPNPSRYEAVNLQNRETIEFRIFKGTLAFSGIMRALESAHAIVSYCAPCAGTKLADCQSHQGFVRWVSRTPQASRYSHLLTWLREHRYLPPVTKPHITTTANTERSL